MSRNRVSGTKPAVLFKMPAMRLLDRYLDGRSIQVWSEVHGIGAEIRHPQTRPDAEAVAREAMAPIARNVARLRKGLAASSACSGEPVPRW